VAITSKWKVSLDGRSKIRGATGRIVSSISGGGAGH